LEASCLDQCAAAFAPPELPDELELPEELELPDDEPPEDDPFEELDPELPVAGFAAGFSDFWPAVFSPGAFSELLAGLTSLDAARESVR